ncbi:MAG: MarR family transcriptional regulator [Clostridiaceae bacterium]|nr:MarR family transcriptional regulator [Clostridiaceae bacterium]
MELNKCINFLLTKTQQVVFQQFKASLAEYDVTPVQYGVLKCLWCQDGQNPSQIAGSLSLDNSTISGILDRMENKGVIKRVADRKDRRSLKVVLTEQGRLLEAPVTEIIEKENKNVLYSLSEEEQATLVEYLNRISSGEISLRNDAL